MTALTTRVSTAEGKITALEEVGAEKNIIASVDEAQFAVDAERKLTLLDITMGKVTGLSDALAGKVDKVEGYTLFSPDDAAKLAGISESAERNIIASVDTNQFAIDESRNLTLLDVAMSKVTGLSSALEGKVDKEELGNWITTNRDSIAGLFSSSDATKLAGIAEGAEVNKIDAIKVNGVELTISDKAVDIPIATAEALGVVLSSTVENKVSVGADGTMEVNRVNVNKLTQTDGDSLILNGGSSAD